MQASLVLQGLRCRAAVGCRNFWPQPPDKLPDASRSFCDLSDPGHFCSAAEHILLAVVARRHALVAPARHPRLVMVQAVPNGMTASCLTLNSPQRHSQKLSCQYLEARTLHPLWHGSAITLKLPTSVQLEQAVHPARYCGWLLNDRQPYAGRLVERHSPDRTTPMPIVNRELAKKFRFAHASWLESTRAIGVRACAATGELIVVIQALPVRSSTISCGTSIAPVTLGKDESIRGIPSTRRLAKKNRRLLPSRSAGFWL